MLNLFASTQKKDSKMAQQQKNHQKAGEQAFAKIEKIVRNARI